MDFAAMAQRGEVSEQLLTALLKAKSDPQSVDTVRRLMLKYGLLVRLFASDETPEAERKYTVPALLPAHSVPSSLAPALPFPTPA